MFTIRLLTGKCVIHPPMNKDVNVCVHGYSKQTETSSNFCKGMTFEICNVDGHYI